MRVQAIWNEAIIADSDRTVVVEGNHYFPADDADSTYLRSSKSHTVCPWKGVASYYDVVVDGKINHDAAWYYPKPSRLARKVSGHIAFWHGVQIRKVGEGGEAEEPTLWARLRRRITA